MLDRFAGGRAPVDGVDSHGHRKSEKGDRDQKGNIRTQYDHVRPSCYHTTSFSLQCHLFNVRWNQWCVQLQNPCCFFQLLPNQTKPKDALSLWWTSLGASVPKCRVAIPTFPPLFVLTLLLLDIRHALLQLHDPPLAFCQLSCLCLSIYRSIACLQDCVVGRRSLIMPVEMTYARSLRGHGAKHRADCRWNILDVSECKLITKVMEDIVADRDLAPKRSLQVTYAPGTPWKALWKWPGLTGPLRGPTQICDGELQLFPKFRRVDEAKCCETILWKSHENKNKRKWNCLSLMGIFEGHHVDW